MAGSGEQTPSGVRPELTERPARRAVPARSSSAGESSASVGGKSAKAAAKGTAKKAPAKKAPAKKAPAKKASAKKAAAKKSTANKSTPESLVVRADERPWTEEELAEVRELLTLEAARLREEIAEAENGIAEMLRDSTDSGGEDQADTGSKTFEREHEMALAASHREILGQTERALTRIENGTYGICESCGKPIGKARLQAFPRATLCMACKEREERR